MLGTALELGLGAWGLLIDGKTLTYGLISWALLAPNRWLPGPGVRALHLVDRVIPRVPAPPSPPPAPRPVPAARSSAATLLAVAGQSP